LEIRAAIGFNRQTGEFYRPINLSRQQVFLENLCNGAFRTQRTKGCGSRIATLTMVFKLGLKAQKHWRRLNGSALLPKVVIGAQFIDGEELEQQAA
jgi:hypothetical protein